MANFSHKWTASPEVSEQARQSGSAASFAVAKLGFQADAKQKLVLESTAKRGILNCSRQWGKSSVAAVKAVHRAATVAEQLVVVASPSERQSAEFLRKAGNFVRRMGGEPRGDGDNAHSILFPNGSRIVGLPGTQATVRGFSAVSLMVIDEASRVQDEMYKALRPMLAVSDGDLWVLSTPNGRRGFFHDAWANGGAEWLKVSAPATECSRISAAFLEEERKEMGHEWFEQEYMCGFVDGAAEWFGRELLDAALIDEAALVL